ncbi:hypothetical protein UlMin_032173 [Ulmus minor]
MINPKKLLKIARKWQKIAAISSRRISFTGSNKDESYKGHFVIYTADQRRFAMPLAYLKHNIFRELLRMSEEEFGICSDGPITFPCDGVFMDYVLKQIQRGLAKDLEKALLETTSCHSFSSSFHQGVSSQQCLVCGN